MMKTRWRYRFATAPAILCALAPIISPARANHGECGISIDLFSNLDDIVATPAEQSGLVGSAVSITVRAFTCKGDELTDEYVQGTVTGANSGYHADGWTPFTFTYVGTRIGRDSIAFTGIAPIITGAGIESATVDWTPTEASIDAGGSVADVYKDEGDLTPKVGGVVAFACHADAPGASQVTIASCTAGTFSAPPVTAPGPIAATSLASYFSDDQDMKVCWTATAVFSTGSITTSDCEL